MVLPREEGEELKPQVLRTLLNKTDFPLPSMVGTLQPTPHATQRGAGLPLGLSRPVVSSSLEGSKDNSSGLDLSHY